MSGTGGAESPEPPGGYFPMVYDELKRLAAARLAGERAGHSLDATALVHEAYLRLGEASFANRSGFFRAAAVAMQRILVDHARRRKSGRRGGGARTLALEGDAPTLGADPDLVLDVDLGAGTASAGGRDGGRGRPPSPLRRVVGRRGRPGDGRLARHRLPRVGLCPVLASDRGGLGPMTERPRPVRPAAPAIQPAYPRLDVAGQSRLLHYGGSEVFSPGRPG